MKIAMLIATTLAAQAEEPRKPFVPRMTTLRGASLQPATGLQPAAGVEPSGERGRGEIAMRPMSEAEWRALFPKKAGQR